MEIKALASAMKCNPNAQDQAASHGNAEAEAKAVADTDNQAAAQGNAEAEAKAVADTDNPAEAEAKAVRSKKRKAVDAEEGYTNKKRQRQSQAQSKRHW